MRRAPTERQKLDFSIATINVVFLLLLFFILSGTIVERSETEIDPALTRSLPVERLPRPLLVLRGPDDIVLDGRPTGRADLPAALSALRRNAEKRQVENRNEGPVTARIFVLSPGNLASFVLLDVVASIRSSGFAVSLVTLRARPDRRSASPPGTPVSRSDTPEASPLGAPSANRRP